MRQLAGSPTEAEKAGGPRCCDPWLHWGMLRYERGSMRQLAGSPTEAVLVMAGGPAPVCLQHLHLHPLTLDCVHLSVTHAGLL
jgi:hypothetical protein